MTGPERAATYAAAGVDVEAGERAVDLMRAAISRAQRPEVVGGVGGFAGLFDASRLRDMRRPLLATSTDGVGTKVKIAQMLDVHDTIGIDLVAMVVDDIVVCGAEPLFMTDYIAVGSVVPERVAAIVAGIAEGCRLAGVALAGGETAEHPGLLGPDEYDVAGAATGVVEADDLLGPDRVRDGDVVIALASSGLHSNGYSLARHVLLARAGWALDREVPELGRSLGAELLEPTRIYTLDLLHVLAGADHQPIRGSGGAGTDARQGAATDGRQGAGPDAAGSGGNEVERTAPEPAGVRALAHITGGGLAANLARVLPPGMHAVVERGTWRPPAIFEVIADVGAVTRDECERTFNQGVGMMAVVSPDDADSIVARLAQRQVHAWMCGQVRTAVAGDRSDAPAKGGSGGSVHLVGEHR